MADSGGGPRGPRAPPFGKVKKSKRAPLTENSVCRSRKRKSMRYYPPPIDSRMLLESTEKFCYYPPPLNRVDMALHTKVGPLLRKILDLRLIHVHIVLVNKLSMPLTLVVPLQEQYQGMQEIFRKSFRLLKAMARGNVLVQQRLFDRLDILLNIKGAEPELAEALIEVRQDIKKKSCFFRLQNETIYWSTYTCNILVD